MTQVCPHADAFEPLDVPVAVHTGVLTKCDPDLMVGLAVPALGADLIDLYRLFVRLNYVDWLRLWLLLPSYLNDTRINLEATLLAPVPLGCVLHEGATFIAEPHGITPRKVLTVETCCI